METKMLKVLVDPATRTNEPVGRWNHKHLGDVACPFCGKMNTIGREWEYSPNPKLIKVRRCKHNERISLGSLMGTYMVSFVDDAK